MTGERAILWLAVSTEKQAEDDKESLVNQEQRLREKADREGWKIVDTIRVPGFSRRYHTFAEFADAVAEAGHPDALRMWGHWERHDFDVLCLRDGSRMGREQSIFAEFVQRTRQAGACIFDDSYGLVDGKNARVYAMVGGYQAAQEIDNFVERTKIGKRGLMKRGLPASGRIPFTHTPIRDTRTGRRVEIRVEPKMRRFLDDLATLILEGVAWNDLERLLYIRFGHVNARTGKPYTSPRMYYLLHNPIFWGHAAQHYTHRNEKYGRNGGAWTFEEGEAPPEGVSIVYNSPLIEPAYKGDLADKVKAELLRRKDIRGRAKPYETRRFAGLFICGECGHTLGSRTQSAGTTVRGNRRKDGSYYQSTYKRDYQYYNCPNKSRQKCSQGSALTGERAIVEFTKMIKYMLYRANPDDYFTPEGGTDNLPQLRAEIVSVEDQMKRLIREQASAPDAAQELYREQIAALAERLEILRSNLDSNQRTAAAGKQEARARQTALEQIRALPDVSELWNMDERKCNQLLHMVIGRNRFVVVNGQIVGHVQHTGRKRSNFR
ncbi:MAG: recombinase family protein [Chloroflexota bacterium]|nr:recombinase family protein [Chloroflexota bacterium]